MVYVKNDDLTLEYVLGLVKRYGYTDVTQQWSFGSLVIEASPSLVGVFFDLETARQWIVTTHREQCAREKERNAGA